MGLCEHHKDYTNLLNDRVTSELDGPARGRQDWGRVMCVVTSIIIDHDLEKISCEEADMVYGRVCDLYPEFAERLKSEVKKSFAA